jgi:hypothetical protein
MSARHPGPRRGFCVRLGAAGGVAVAVLRPVASTAEAGESGELAYTKATSEKVDKWGLRVSKPMWFGFGGS